MPIKSSEILADQIPGAIFVALEGVGHLPAVEQPLKTAALVLDFARQHT